MSEPILNDWVDVNSYMRDDYRLLVATMAARQLKNADTELQTLARTAFGSVSVPGARSFFRADLVQQRRALAKAMQTQPQVAALVIALWAQAAESHVTLLKQAGEQAGIQFSDQFNWQTGIKGFYAFEDIPLLSALADGLGEKMSEQDYDHLKLAALWLGPAITNLSELPAPVPSEGASDSPAEPPTQSE